MNKEPITNEKIDNDSAPARGGLIQKIIIAVAFFAIGFIFNALGAHVQFGPLAQNKNTIDLTKFWQVNDILHQKFDGNIDAQKQTQGAIAGMVASLGDPYTTYLSEQANKDLANQLDGKLSGIGVEIGIKNNHLTVIAPIEGTPASKAGIRSGDIIAAVDGQDTSSMTIDEAVSKIRGSKDTKVKLAIVHPGEGVKEIEITRDNITVPSVTSEIKPDGIGYIKIRTFGSDTSAAVEAAAANFASSGVKAVIIDVRDDPGGYLDGAVNVSSQFMSTGTVVEERSRTGENKILSAIAGGKLTNIPVVVLVNGGSASASEIMAGALHDNGRATLVGEKTFGKGSVQEVICLGGISFSTDCKSDSLKVTIAHWYTPKGINISKEGIKPDVEVKLSTDDYNSGRDPQLDKALEVARQKINK